jgi:hypothetical protein
MEIFLNPVSGRPDDGFRSVPSHGLEHLFLPFHVFDAIITDAAFTNAQDLFQRVSPTRQKGMPRHTSSWSVSRPFTDTR